MGARSVRVTVMFSAGPAEHMGRPPKTTEAQRQIIHTRLVKGETVTGVVRDFKVSRATVLTVRDKARP